MRAGVLGWGREGKGGASAASLKSFPASTGVYLPVSRTCHGLISHLKHMLPLPSEPPSSSVFLFLQWFVAEHIPFFTFPTCSTCCPSSPTPWMRGAPASTTTTSAC